MIEPRVPALPRRIARIAGCALALAAVALTPDTALAEQDRGREHRSRHHGHDSERDHRWSRHHDHDSERDHRRSRHDDEDDERDGRRRHVCHDRCRVAHRTVHVTAPRIIHHHDVQRYEPYYERVEYYRPHRHRHAVYVFPVYVHGRYVHRPHHYCGGRLFGGYVQYDGPRLHVGVGF
jgi:hypothetical protein